MTRIATCLWAAAVAAMGASAPCGGEIVHIRAAAEGEIFADDFGLLSFVGGPAPMVAEFRYDTDAQPIDDPSARTVYRTEFTLFVGGRQFVGADATVSVLELAFGGIFQDEIDFFGPIPAPDPNPPQPGLPEVVVHYFSLSLTGTGDLLAGTGAPPASVYDLSNPDLFTGTEPRLELVYAGPTDPIGMTVTSRMSGQVLSFEVIPAPSAAATAIAAIGLLGARRRT